MAARIDYNTLTESAAQNYGSVDSNLLPTYQYAADGHNAGNFNFSLTDTATWGEGLDRAGKFVATAAISGANSFYNSGVTVGNWLGADLEQSDTQNLIASIDDNLGAYYGQNKDSVDLAGFVLSSIVPGMGGVKLLQAGQKALKVASEAGKLGSNLSRATGLLVPNTSLYRGLAAAEISASSANFSAITSSSLRAIGAGYGQAALEAAAFETAVAATMFKSPVLSDADGWDIAKNIAVGTVVGGVIGGAINHAITVSGIKKSVKAFNPAEKQFADTSDLTGLPASQRIIARSDRLFTLPEVPTAEELASGAFQGAEEILKGLPRGEAEIVAGKLSSRLGRLKEETVSSLELKNREDFQSLVVGSDSAFANQLADFTKGIDPNQVTANFEALTEMGRVSQKLKAEASNTSAIKKSGAGGVIDLDAPLDPLPYQIGYVKLKGEGVGTVSFDIPKILNLADTLSSKDEVLGAVKKFGFKEGTIWNSVEQGFDHFTSEARYIWADRFAKTADGMKIGEYDIPLLERALKDKLASVEIVSPKGNYVISNSQDLYKHVTLSKQEAASELLNAKKAGVSVSTEEIAKITNTRMSYLEGEISRNPTDDLFARQTQQSAYAKELERKGLYSDSKVLDYDLHPSYAKASYDAQVLNAVDQYQLNGMAYIKAQQKLYAQGVDATFSAYVPEELVSRFWHPGDEMLLKTNRFGSGPGLVTFANGGYHTPESWAESLGSATSALQKNFKDKSSALLQSSAYKIATKQEAALEFESINKTLQSTSELYGIAPGGSRLVPLKQLDYEARIAAGERNVPVPALQEGAPREIPFVNPEVAEAWTLRTELTSGRTKAFQDVRNAQGLTDMKDPRALRPIRHDPKEYPYYAVVVDESVSGVGHKSMVHAASAGELEALISKVPENYQVYKGDQLKQYFKSQGEFDWEMTLHENYIDSDLRRSGVNNPFFVRTDPQLIAQKWLQDHFQSDDIFAREIVNAKYEKEFRFLRQQGEQYTSTATSRYTGSFRDIENTTKNPYLNYIKTALNVSQVGEHPYLQGFNQLLDSAYSKFWNTIGGLTSAAKKPEDLDAINSAFQKYGLKTAYYDASTDLLANHTAPRGALQSFVGKANSILSTLTLRLDPFNAINNAVGATVLYGTELKSVVRAISRGDEEIAGALGGLLKTPRASEGLIAEGGANAAGVESVTSAGKLMQNAIKNWFSPDAKTASGVPLREYYQKNGWSTRLIDQHIAMMDDLTLAGKETASDLTSKMNSAFAKFQKFAEVGEKYSGNKYAEEFNRFVAADSMRQITDLGISKGLLSEGEAIGYINTFVNRTQGNILASQRPLMFQGAVGQAVGLFQSYQFNMMQQLFRHVGEGRGKDVATLLGLQGTMYGMNGLPAFNYLNTHIVGTASGNPNHTDAYTATYGAVGKNVGDLLLYGLPSNLLHANLYTRGDINPRQVTVIPVNPADIPFVNAAGKFYDNVKNTMAGIANGGDIWKTILQGVEHNGLSRPLAGVAQVAEAAFNNGVVFATTNKGNISGSNELYSLATAARLAGAKPLDESIASDATFRIQAYAAADKSKVDALAKALKSHVVGNPGAQIDPDVVGKFAQDYAAIGGKQGNFNKWMMNQIKGANTLKANSLMDGLKSPYAQKMQQIMGGTPLISPQEISNNNFEFGANPQLGGEE